MSGRMHWERLNDKPEVHRNKYSRQVGKLVYCPACQQPFRDEQKYKEHWKEKHNNTHV